MILLIRITALIACDPASIATFSTVHTECALTAIQSCILCLFDVLPLDNVSDLSADSGLTVPHFDDTLLLPEDLFSGSLLFII